jgi:hypothetical protein
LEQFHQQELQLGQDNSQGWSLARIDGRSDDSADSTADSMASGVAEM